MKVKKVEFSNNDIYYMDILDELLVVNDNYQGILIFDSELRQTNRIELMDDLNIYTSLKKNKELILFCPDNNCLIYVDLDLSQKKIISLSGFDSWIFSPMYDWKGKRLILSDYQGHFLKINLDTGCLLETNSNDKECQEINKDYIKLNKFKIFKIYVSEKEALVEFSDTKLSIVDYKQHLNILKVIEKEQYHDFELTDGYIAKIGERKVESLFQNRREIYYPSEQYIYLRGKFMVKDEETFLFLLSGDKADSSHIKIEKCKF